MSTFISNSRIMLTILLFTLFFLPVAGYCQMTIEIKVAPNVLNLKNKGQVVTVHTDLAYGAVAATTVTLNGVAIDHWKADNQGNFVAKFLIEAIKELPLNIGEYNTLVLEGYTKTGEAFTGSYDVLVVDKGK